MYTCIEYKSFRTDNYETQQAVICVVMYLVGWCYVTVVYL